MKPYDLRVVMEEDDGIELPSWVNLESSRAASRASERSFAMATPVQVTFVVMGATTFDHTFACTPDYGELWRALCKQLHVDAGSPVGFTMHMDDVLLTNRNTVDMFREVVMSATTTASVLLTVTKHTDIDHAQKPRPRARAGCCSWACPHTFFLLCFVLLGAIMKVRMWRLEDKVEEDWALIDSLTRTLAAVRKQQALKIAKLDGEIEGLTNEIWEGNKTAAGEALQWVDEKTQRAAAISNLTGTLKALDLKSADTAYRCTTEIYNLTSFLREDNYLLRTQAQRLRRAPGAIAKLRGDLASAQDTGKIDECAKKTGEIQGDFNQTEHRAEQLSLYSALQADELKKDEAEIDRLHKEVQKMRDNARPARPARPATGHYKWVCDGIIGFM